MYKIPKWIRDMSEASGWIDYTKIPRSEWPQEQKDMFAEILFELYNEGVLSEDRLNKNLESIGYV